MSSFKHPMGEGNTGNFDTPFGGKGGPSGEFAPPIPPAPKAEGATFTPPVHSVPKVGEATFTPPAPPKGEGKAFTPPVPSAPNEPEELHTPQEDDKGGKGKDKKDATKSSGRGDSGRPKSTQRMLPWVAAVVVVVAVVAGVLGYGYFANEGNNPVGEKLGFSHAKVTDQSTSASNQGQYGSDNKGDSSQGGIGGANSGSESNNTGSDGASRPADDVLKDGDYGKELVTKKISLNDIPDLGNAHVTKLDIQYKPNRTMKSFLDECIQFDDSWTVVPIEGTDNKVGLGVFNKMLKYNFEEDKSEEVGDDVKYEYGHKFLNAVSVILAAAYQSGVPDPSAVVSAVYISGGGVTKAFCIGNFSLHNSIESYRFNIANTDPELWVKEMYPNGVPEGVVIPPVPESGL